MAAATGSFAVTHEATDAAGTWLELLADGLAFDLTGIADGAAVETPPGRYRFGLEDALLGSLEAIALVPGPHLADGATMMPVVRSQLALTLRLARLPEVQAVAWAPAQSWMSVDYFDRLVAAWLQGGVFPALGLTAFGEALDGGLQSEGLAFFTGQELRIEPELAEDRVAATRLAIRLMNELVAQDPVAGRHEFIGPDGTPLVIEPSANGRFVRVRAAE